MALTVLENDFALTVGCDLWIVADAEASHWSRRIDWLLNFQIRRAALHQAPTLAPQLSDLIKECEAEPPSILPVAPLSPLMIASAQLVPSKQTVMIPNLSVSDWAKACHHVWVRLGKPLTRVFLPDAIKPDEFTRHWPVDETEARGIEIVH